MVLKLFDCLLHCNTFDRFYLSILFSLVLCSSYISSQDKFNIGYRFKHFFFMDKIEGKYLLRSTSSFCFVLGEKNKSMNTKMFSAASVLLSTLLCSILYLFYLRISCLMENVKIFFYSCFQVGIFTIWKRSTQFFCLILWIRKIILFFVCYFIVFVIVNFIEFYIDGLFLVYFFFSFNRMLVMRSYND